MITVEFTEAEAQAVADAVLAYIDDDYYPAIDLEALRTAYKRLAWTIGNPGLKAEWARLSDFRVILTHCFQQCRFCGVGLARQVFDAGSRGRQSPAGDAVMMATQQQVH